VPRTRGSSHEFAAGCGVRESSLVRGEGPIRVTRTVTTRRWGWRATVQLVPADRKSGSTPPCSPKSRTVAGRWPCARWAVLPRSAGVRHRARSIRPHRRPGTGPRV